MPSWLPDVLGLGGVLLACLASYKYGYERGRRVQVQSDVKALGPVEARMDKLRADVDTMAKNAPRDPPSGPRSRLQ